MSRTLHLFGTDSCATVVPIRVIRWYRLQCHDGTVSCATVVPIRRYCQRIENFKKIIVMSYTFAVFLYSFFIFICIYFSQVKKKNVLFLSLVLPVLVYSHSFVITGSVPDLTIYKDAFYEIKNLDILDSNVIDYLNVNYKFEYGYIVLMKCWGIISDNFNLFLCVSSCFLFFFYTKTILRYSPNVGVSILIFLAIIFDQSLFVLRQHLSIAIILLSIPYIIERNLPKFLLILFIAFLFHKSSLIWGGVYFFYGFKKPLQIFVSLGLVALGLVFVFRYLSFLNDILSLGYSSYIDGAKTGHSNYVPFFISLSMFVIYLITCGKEIFATGIMKICTLSLYIHVILSFVGINLSLLSRFSLVFETSLIFIIPIVIFKLRTNFLRGMYFLLCISCYGYINYFGSFSQYLEKMQLYVLNLDELLVFLLLTSFSLFFLFKTKKVSSRKSKFYNL